MAQPSEAELQTQWKAVAKMANEFRKYLSVNGSGLNHVALEDAYRAALKTDYPSSVEGGLAAFRSRMDAAMRDLPSLLGPIFTQYTAIIGGGAPERDPASALRRMWDYFTANSYSIQSRGFTYGSVSAVGSPSGTGSILRVTEDEDQHKIDAGYAEKIVATCIQDGVTGAEKHEETFELAAPPRYKDAVKYTSSGEVATMSAVSARGSLLNNPSFDFGSGTDALPTDITDWTSSTAVIGDGTDYQIDRTNYYRDYPGQSSPGALKILLTRSLTQLASVRRSTFDPNRPYFAQIAYNRAVNSATGTLKLNLGNQQVSVVLAAQTGWNILRTNLDYRAWYKNWKMQAPSVIVDWTRTGGTGLLVDDLIVAPFEPFAGRWYCPMGGATPFLRNDAYTWTDTCTESGILQLLTWLAFGVYLPHAGSPTIADPT